MTRLKTLAQQRRDEEIVDKAKASETALAEVSDEIWAREKENNDLGRPAVRFLDTEKDDLTQERRNGDLVYNKSEVFRFRPKPKREKKKRKAIEVEFENQIKAVATILEAYGVFDGMTYDRQQDLLKDIVRIFSTSELNIGA